jgi:hypothetical protein
MADGRTKTTGPATRLTELVPAAGARGRRSAELAGQQSSRAARALQTGGGARQGGRWSAVGVGKEAACGRQGLLEMLFFFLPSLLEIEVFGLETHPLGRSQIPGRGCCFR